MHATLSTSQCTVIDDFLPAAEFAQVQGLVSRSEYKLCHEGAVSKVWRPGDGMPLHSDPLYFASREVPAQLRQAYAFHPFNNALDGLFERVHAMLKAQEALFGSEGRDWEGFVARQYVYPAGSALSLHTDGGERYAGGFIYYCQPRWNVHWGGALIILDSRTRLAPATDFNVWLNPASEEESALSPGVGSCIFPKANRLVLLAPDTLHLISRVDASAGMACRMSVAGFLLRR